MTSSTEHPLETSNYGVLRKAFRNSFLEKCVNNNRRVNKYCSSLAYGGSTYTKPNLKPGSSVAVKVQKNRMTVPADKSGSDEQTASWQLSEPIIFFPLCSRQLRSLSIYWCHSYVDQRVAPDFHASRAWHMSPEGGLEFQQLSLKADR